MFNLSDKSWGIMWRNRRIVLGLLMLVSSVWSSTGFLTDAQQNHRTDALCVWDKRSDEGSDKAQKIMYNQQSRQREAMRYQIIASEACEPLARRIEEVRGLAMWIDFDRYPIIGWNTLTIRNFAGISRPIYLSSNHLGEIS